MIDSIKYRFKGFLKKIIQIIALTLTTSIIYLVIAAFGFVSEKFSSEPIVVYYKVEKAKIITPKGKTDKKVKTVK